MGILTREMWQMVLDQRLSFVATVRPDGTPNLCPSGTLTVWDADHLVFADIRSSQTITNLHGNPAIEINVVDPEQRKGYRFSGTSRIYSSGPLFDEVVSQYRRRGTTNPVRSVVLVKVDKATLLSSPSYDAGLTEADVKKRWKRFREAIRKGERPGPTGE